MAIVTSIKSWRDVLHLCAGAGGTLDGNQKSAFVLSIKRKARVGHAAMAEALEIKASKASASTITTPLPKG